MADSLSFLAIQVFGLLPAATWQSWIWSHTDGAVLLVRLPPLLFFRDAIIIAVHCNCYQKCWLPFLSVLPSFFGDLWCYHHFLLVISGYIQQAAETTSNKWWQHTVTATRKTWFTEFLGVISFSVTLQAIRWQIIGGWNWCLPRPLGIGPWSWSFNSDFSPPKNDRQVGSRMSGWILWFMDIYDI